MRKVRPIVRNEVKEFQDLKSFGASEATWRIFEFQMSKRYPAITRLPIHLPKEQPVFFHEDTSITEALERSEVTELTEFFEYTTANLNVNVPYIQFPEKFVFEKKQWKIRKQGNNTVRMFSVVPASGDLGCKVVPAFLCGDPL